MENSIKSNVIQFIFGGKAEFTIVNRVNNVGVKYKIISNSSNKNMWFVYVAEGNSYVYAGFLKNTNGKIIYERGKRGNLELNSKPIKGLFWVFKNQDKIGDKVEVVHHGKCAVCGRPLTDIESIERGIGPTCLKRVL